MVWKVYTSFFSVSDWGFLCYSVVCFFKAPVLIDGVYPCLHRCTLHTNWIIYLEIDIGTYKLDGFCPHCHKSLSGRFVLFFLKFPIYLIIKDWTRGNNFCHTSIVCCHYGVWYLCFSIWWCKICLNSDKCSWGFYVCFVYFLYVFVTIKNSQYITMLRLYHELLYLLSKRFSFIPGLWSPVFFWYVINKKYNVEKKTSWMSI